MTQINLSLKQKQTHRHRDQICGCQEGGRGEQGWTRNLELAAAAAAKSLQSCRILCDPIDGSPPRLPRPWDSPGKNTGVGCHFLLQCIKVERENESEVVQSCLTFRARGLQPTRLLRPWDFPGKSTGVGCHCLLHWSWQM